MLWLQHALVVIVFRRAQQQQQQRWWWRKWANGGRRRKGRQAVIAASRGAHTNADRFNGNWLFAHTHVRAHGQAAPLSKDSWWCQCRLHSQGCRGRTRDRQESATRTSSGQFDLPIVRQGCERHLAFAAKVCGNGHVGGQYSVQMRQNIHGLYAARRVTDKVQRSRVFCLGLSNC
jgi:hypothetical protein